LSERGGLVDDVDELARRLPVLGIELEDSTDVRGLAVRVVLDVGDVERRLDERVEPLGGGIVGERLEAAVGATLRVDGREGLGAEVPERVRAFGHEAVDQDPVRREVVDRRPVLVAHPVGAVGRHDDALEVAAEGVRRQRLTEEVDRRLVVVGEAGGLRGRRVVGAAGDRRGAVGPPERHLALDLDRAVLGVHREPDDPRLVVGQRERAVLHAVAVHVHGPEVRATVGNGHEGVGARRLVDTRVVDAGESAELERLAGERGPEVGHLGEQVESQLEVTDVAGVVPLLETERLDVDDREEVVLVLGVEGDDRDRVVLLAGHHGVEAAVHEGQVLGLHVLGDGGARGVQTDPHLAQLVDPGVERAEAGLEDVRPLVDGGGSALWDPDDRHGALGIDEVVLRRNGHVLVRLSLVRGQAVHAVRAERDHVRQRAGGDLLQEGQRGSVVELDHAPVLVGVLGQRHRGDDVLDVLLVDLAREAPAS
jgi:hypothetical protein